MIGEIRYRNFDDEPEINDSDRRIIGDTNPDFTYGLTTNFSWKGISLSLFFQGMYGNDIFNANLMNITMESIANITKDAYDNRWTPDNYENAKWPRATMTMTRSMKVSDRYVEDGSYLKLKTLTLGYTFNPKWKGVSSIHVYGNINNVFTLTKYSWFDPDVNAFGNDASRRGVDIFSYPASRTCAFGFKLVL